MKLKLFFLVLCTNVTVAFSQCEATYYTGQGTFYNYSGGGNCSFPKPYTTLYSAALNNSQYANADLCGACAEITGVKGTITVSLEDKCPECMQGDIDLEADAFPFIDEPVNGRVPIRWKIVPCPITGPVSFFFKEGSSAFWNAVQIRNHALPIRKLEYLNNGTFQEMKRESYNYFTLAQVMGPGPFTYRITDYYGGTITEENIPLLVETPIVGKNQFSSCITVSVHNPTIQSSMRCYPSQNHDGGYVINSNESKQVSYTIYSATGIKVEEGTISPNSNQEILPKPKGIYILHMMSESKEMSTKLVF